MIIPFTTPAGLPHIYGGKMKTTKKRGRPAARRRRSLKQTEAENRAARFLHRTFYYLKAEQFIKMSTRLLCEAV